MKHDGYFNYLCSIVKKRKKYEKLLRMLHSIHFYALIPYDDNREMDGIQVRIFIEERGFKPSLLTWKNTKNKMHGFRDVDSLSTTVGI